MPSLLYLPQPALDLVVYFLDPYTRKSSVLGDRLRTDSYLHTPPADTVALSSTCKEARRLLAPTIFEYIPFKSEIHEALGKERVEWLAERGGALLEHVRTVAVCDLKSDALTPLVQCLRRMVNLKCYTHCTISPLPPTVAEALTTLSHLEVFQAIGGGVESLPRLLPLGSRLKTIGITTARAAPRFASDWDLCPITVAAERRNKLSRDWKNVATVREQAEAVVEHLAKLLFAMKDHVEVISVYGDGLSPWQLSRGDPWAHDWLQHLFERLKLLNGGKDYPVFPELEGVFFAGCDMRCKGFAHLLETSPKIREVELTEGTEKSSAPWPAPPQPLRKLEYLYVLPENDTPVSAFIREISHRAPLKRLTINGLMHDQIPEVFEDPFQHLCRLDLDSAGRGSCTIRHLNLIARRCPNLRHLRLFSGFWVCEVVEIFDALRPLSRLRFFAFDHPWEAPRTAAFLACPDGRTIRSNRYGHFTVISIMEPGMTVNDEMKRRIREDIDTVLPTYHKRFAKVAKAHPSLRTIEWTATDEVTWTWHLVRDGDLDSGKLKLKHKPVIEIEAQDSVPIQQPGTFLRATPGAGCKPAMERSLWLGL